VFGPVGALLRNVFRVRLSKAGRLATARFFRSVIVYACLQLANCPEHLAVLIGQVILADEPTKRCERDITHHAAVVVAFASGALCVGVVVVVESIGRRICKTATRRHWMAGRRQICKMVIVLRGGVERRDRHWLAALMRTIFDQEVGVGLGCQGCWLTAIPHCD
jgi:hypothetical protein